MLLVVVSVYSSSFLVLFLVRLLVVILGAVFPSDFYILLRSE